MRDFHAPGRSAVYATDGMVATSHPLAAQAALDVLKEGGNAVDAALTGAVLLGLCEPQMTGIGGDLFALIAPDPAADIIALNGSGRAPKALDTEAIRTKGDVIAPYSIDAVTIPGAMDAICTLAADHGRLGLDRILAPAIHYAEAGVPVAPRVAFDWAEGEGNLSGHARSLFLDQGAAPKVGTLFRAPGQAEVLRAVARDGRAGFYEGAVAEDMVRSLRAAGGPHTLEDFAETRCDYTAPISGTYRGTELVEHPPNGQGATAILMANILAEFNPPADPFGTARAHLEAEAAKLAYDTRNRLMADADHMTRLAHMLDPGTAKRLAALIDPSRAMPDPRALSEAVHKDTIYITVVDGDRMAVSLIYSIFHSFGSGIASDRYGILFQNRGAGFTLERGHPNEVAGGKRPMHTIIPAMLREKGRATMPFGVMGGAYQPNGHARMLSNLVDYGMDLQAALDAPRCFSDAGEMKVERGYSDRVRAELSDLGHIVSIPETPIGGAQAIRIREDGVLEGASDPRKDGCALGY
ncbi:MAG: gamma-glutamyltransferase family protein [Shimia sp.]